MRRLAALALLPALAGCFLLPAGERSEVKEVPPELKQPRLVAPAVKDRHVLGDVTKLAVGQWAAYREGGRTVTVAVVAQSAEGLWIEVIEEGEPSLASARLVAPDGVVKKAFYREISKEGASIVVAQPLSQWTAPPSSHFVETGRDTGEEVYRVGDRELRSRRVRVKYDDLDGRTAEEVTLWHPEVPPVWAGNDGGGLVRKVAGGVTLELVAFGADAKPRVEIPQ